MEDISATAQGLLGASLAGNTFLVYQNAVSNFTKFRQEYIINEIWPVPVSHIMMFIACCFERGYSPATISTYISGISFVHKIRDWPDPTEQFIVKKLVEGCRRSRPRRDQRAPITLPVLTKVVAALPAVCYSNYEAKLFTAAYLLAYYGMLRVSEIVFTTQAQANKPLLVDDLTVGPKGDSIQIRIRFSKTNQYGIPTFLRIPSANSSVCCVAAIRRFLLVRPLHHRFLFCHANGSPVTRSQFSGVLSKAIQRLGMPVGVFKSHSFRIGRATSLASQGVPSEAIQTMGRWRSSAYKNYIRIQV